jgi:hypothetical protein
LNFGTASGFDNFKGALAWFSIRAKLQRLQRCSKFLAFTQGSSFVATLGWSLESLWDLHIFSFNMNRSTRALGWGLESLQDMHRESLLLQYSCNQMLSWEKGQFENSRISSCVVMHLKVNSVWFSTRSLRIFADY